MKIFTQILIYFFTRKNIKKIQLFPIIAGFLAFTNLNAQFYVEHDIAPAPWQYLSDANEIVLATDSATNVSVTISLSDGTLITTLNVIAGTPTVYRFNGSPASSIYHPINTIIPDAGLKITATAPVAVNLRNVASDQIGDEAINIKGNSSLNSFGSAGVGTRFLAGYYRNTNLNTGYTDSLFNNPIYTVLATNDNTSISVNGTVIVILDEGESYLFQAAMGSIVESSSAIVMNTSARVDRPAGCGDGSIDQIAPIPYLGSEHYIVRGLGNATVEQTTVIASEPNTIVTINTFSETGAFISTENQTLTNVGDFYTFNTGNGTNFSASQVLSDKNIAVFSGTGNTCEVDIIVIAPVSLCGGSQFVESYKFSEYDDTDLPYSGYVILNDATSVVNFNGVDLETLSAPRRQLGTTGWYVIGFNNVQVGNPTVLTLSSAAKLNISIIQQSDEFSMSAVFSNFTEVPEEPATTYITGPNCGDESATISTTPGFAPYQWFFNGVPIVGATSNTYNASASGIYSVSSTLICGEPVRSNPIEIVLCSDVSVTKTIDNDNPIIGTDVNFTITASNNGPSLANGVSVIDLLPSGYTFVSANVPTGTSYDETSGLWSIGSLENGAVLQLIITATVNPTGSYINVAVIDSSNQPDSDTTNNTSTVNPTPLFDPCDPMTPGNGDVDNDGISNNCDSDDDNDGILDINECYAPLDSSFIGFTPNDLGITVSENMGNINTTVDVSSQFNLPVGSVIITVQNGNALGSPLSFRTQEDFRIRFVFSGSVPVYLKVSHDPALEDNGDREGFISLDGQTFTPDTLAEPGYQFSNTNENYFCEVIDENLTDGSQDMSWNSDGISAGVEFYTTNESGYQSSVSFEIAPICDTDNDGTPDALDIDSDNDGCADVIEAGHTDGDSDGEVDGTGVDGNGQVTGFASAYTGTTANVTTAVQVTVDATVLIDQTIINGSGTSFTITSVSAISTTTFANGIPDYTIPTPGTDVSGVLVYQWQRNGVDIDAVMDGGVYSGFNTTTLNISDVTGLGGNVYTLSITHPDNLCVNEQNSATLSIAAPSIEVIKTAAITDDALPTGASLGDEITYTILVENTGNVTLDNITIVDTFEDANGNTLVLSTGPTFVGPSASLGSVEGILLENEIATYTATYIIQQDAVDAGGFSNSVLASGTSPDNVLVDDVSDDDDDTDGNTMDDPTETVILEEPSIEAIKTVAITNDILPEGASLGDEMTYTITVENTGNVTLDNITIVDTFEDINGNTLTLSTGPTFVGPTSSLGSVEGILLVDEIATYIATYVIEESVASAGGFRNSVLASGESPNNTPVSDISDDGDATTDGPDDGSDPTDDPTETETLICLTIYNEFSPNGDGVNETFVIDCLERFPDNTLEIYNRWGNIVYSKKGYLNDWDGTSNGRALINQPDKLPVGTYYYVLDLGDGSEPIVDWLYLNR